MLSTTRIRRQHLSPPHRCYHPTTGTHVVVNGQRFILRAIPTLPTNPRTVITVPDDPKSHLCAPDDEAFTTTALMSSIVTTGSDINERIRLRKIKRKHTKQLYALPDTLRSPPTQRPRVHEPAYGLNLMSPTRNQYNGKKTSTNASGSAR